MSVKMIRSRFDIIFLLQSYYTYASIHSKQIFLNLHMGVSHMHLIFLYVYNSIRNPAFISHFIKINEGRR